MRPAAQLAVGRAVPDERARPPSRTSPTVQQPGHLPGHRRPHDRRPRRLRGPHAVETVGVVDLAKKFDDDEFPAVDDQDDFLQTECAKVATEYAGGDEVITRQEAHRLLGQPHRGLLEGGHPQGQLQPGRAAARPQRVRAGHRVGQGPGHGGRHAGPARADTPGARRARAGAAGRARADDRAGDPPTEQDARRRRTPTVAAAADVPRADPRSRTGRSRDSRCRPTADTGAARSGARLGSLVGGGY